MATTKIERDWQALQAYWDSLLAKSVGMTTDELEDVEDNTRFMSLKQYQEQASDDDED